MPEHATAGLTRLERVDDVWILTMTTHENRLSVEMLAAIDGALDEVEAARGPAGLVLAAEGHIWCNGLDLSLQQEEARWREYMVVLHGLLARLLVFPVPTAASITGHAFGAGAALTLAADLRFMRDDRGYWCFPEVTFGLAPSRAMVELVRSVVPTPVAADVLLGGARYDGSSARDLGIVHGASPSGRVLPSAIAALRPRTRFDRRTVGSLKRRLHPRAHDALRAVADNPR